MGQCTISCRNIPWRISLACRRNSFLGDCAITFEFDGCVMRPIHTGGKIGPQEKLRKEIGGLEGWRKAYVETIQSMSYIVRLYWELDGMWAEALCNLNIFPLLWYYRDQGFMLRLSRKYSSMFMCDCFLILNYMCSIWSFSYSIKIPQVCCRSRTCIFL